MVQVQTHKAIAGLQHSQQHGSVSLCTGVGLHVGIFGTEQLANAVDGQLLHLVHHLATAIVSVAGVALSIFVGQVATHSFHDLVTYKVLTGNELNALQLALVLLLNQLENLIVSFHCLFIVL